MCSFNTKNNAKFIQLSECVRILILALVEHEMLRQTWTPYVFRQIWDNPENSNFPPYSEAKPPIIQGGQILFMKITNPV